MTNPNTMNPVGTALLYTGGEWQELDEDPILKLFQRDGDAVPRLIERLDYTPFTNARHQDRAPLGLTIFRAVPGKPVPPWLVMLEAPPYEEGDLAQYAYVFAARLPDVMDLIGQWSPALHSMAAFEVAAMELFDMEPDPDPDPVPGQPVT